MSKVLEVKDLETEFYTDFGTSRVLDDVSFSVNEGETVGIVGESGSGKSVCSLSIMGLLPKNGRVVNGEVNFMSQNLLGLKENSLNKFRGSKLTMIFQDPTLSLNPVLTIGDQLTEPMRIHMKLGKRESAERAKAILKQVGLTNPQALLKAYPHTLSGGMQQRVMIAIALSCDPLLLIADEPTTALDVTIQAQIMELLRMMRREVRMSLILITHDIGLIAEMADRVLVMYAGQIVEETDVFTLFKTPLHPYTSALLESVPMINNTPGKKLIPIRGLVPEEYGEMKACRFVSRCKFSEKRCREEYQRLQSVGKKGHKVRCWKYAQGGGNE